MLTRLWWFVQSTWWKFALWAYGPWRICYNCLEYEAELHEDDIEHWCKFKGDHTDPNAKGCRAFRGWRIDR